MPTVFTLVSAIILLTFAGLDVDLDKELKVPAYMWLILGFALGCILKCFPKVRLCFPANWILVVLILLLYAMAAAYFMFYYKLWEAAVGLVVTAVVVVLLCVCAAKCPRRILPNGIIAMVILLLLAVAALVLGIIWVVLKNTPCGLSFLALLLLISIILLLYEVQFIHGRFASVPLLEDPIVALAIHIDFLIIFLCLCGLYYFGK
ncbi:uncharacterized protein LOC108601419 [Drosophila busckii]|uniref:uncharacterized protein LOC108601419 n=1 Tax=Drosophila busckii TaxID=30019 RepID=UPI001432EC15|nr:uncharacterized protein LOC108601419 [Drosophila busckii]